MDYEEEELEKKIAKELELAKEKGERKTKTIQIEVYEDQVDDFYASIFYLKKNLRDSMIYLSIKDNYKDPSVFDRYIKGYTDFLQSFFGMIHVPSIVGDSAIPMDSRILIPHIPAPLFLDDIDYETGITLEKADVESGETRFIWDEYTIDQKPPNEITDGYQRAFDFIEYSKISEPLLPVYRKIHLSRFISELSENMKVEVYQTDDFFIAAEKGIPKIFKSDLYNLVLDTRLFGFKHDENTLFQSKPINKPRKITKREQYESADFIYDKIEYFFPDLKDEGGEKLLAITGYILCELGHLYTEEKYLDEVNRTESWWQYLINRSKTWLEQGQN